MTTVNVTQHDIDTGKPACPGKCALALAIARATRMDVIVGVEMARFVIGDRIDSRRLPLPAQEFRRLYDRQGRAAVKPLTFDLDSPAAGGAEPAGK